MSRFYYAPIDAAGVTAGQDVFELVPASEDPIRLWAFEISQVTEAGDAQAEQLELDLIRRTGTPTSGSGGSAATGSPATQDDTATTATVEQDNTTAATGGTAETLLKIGWPLLTFYRWDAPHEDAAFQVKDSDLIHLNLITVPADSVDIVGWVCYSEG